MSAPYIIFPVIVIVAVIVWWFRGWQISVIKDRLRNEPAVVSGDRQLSLYLSALDRIVCPTFCQVSFSVEIRRVDKVSRSPANKKPRDEKPCTTPVKNADAANRKQEGR